MRLEIGPDGKIIGTRRVSPNGQVSGLSEFAGREVLVILPGSSDASSAPAWGSPEAVAQLVEEQMRDAYRRYELLQELYATPWEATRSFVQSTLGGRRPDLAADVDRWIQDQLRRSAPGRPSSSEPDQDGTGAAPAAERRRRGPSHSMKSDASK